MLASQDRPAVQEVARAAAALERAHLELGLKEARTRRKIQPAGVDSRSLDNGERRSERPAVQFTSKHRKGMTQRLAHRFQAIRYHTPRHFEGGREPVDDVGVKAH